MNADTFVDINILLYAHDRDAGFKQERAASLIRTLWGTGAGMTSTQVLQEFYVNVTQKISNPLPYALARRVVQHF